MAMDPITAAMDLGKGLVNFIGNKFLPDKMSEGERAEMELEAQRWVAEQAHREDSSFREFVLGYEGRAKDYENIPFVGPVVLLFRGLIRPVFTVLVGYLDYLFFTEPASAFTGEQAALLKVVNIIVLTFWFGERALTNSGIVDKILSYKRQENEQGTGGK